MTKRTCSTQDCQKTHYGRGWCRFHYQRAYLSGNLEAQPRTLAKPTDSLDARLRNIGWTVTESGCWEWNGAKDNHGYGQMAVNRRRPWKAYRIAYEAWVKVPADNVDICHSCDNPACINPAHLFEGTRQVNVDDMIAKKRHANGERRPNHKVKDEQVSLIRAEYAAGGVSQKYLGVKYGISQAQVSNITRYAQRRSDTNRAA